MDIDLLAQAISKSAVRALSATDDAPQTEAVLKHYRVDANRVAAAVVRTLSEYKVGKSESPTSPVFSRQQLSVVAENLNGGPMTGADVTSSPSPSMRLKAG